jgi:DNA-binding response OmpR family regulator
MNSSNGNDSSGVKSRDLSGVRILLVEDSWHLGKALKTMLQVCGADVTGPVVTSADAQRLASEQPPDAALVDFTLRNGELADVLIDRLNEQGIYVIVMSGHEVLPVAARRAAAILQKPISPATLLSSLRPVVARKKSQKEQLTRG